MLTSMTHFTGSVNWMSTSQVQAPHPGHARRCWWWIPPVVNLAWRTITGKGEGEAPCATPGVFSWPLPRLDALSPGFVSVQDFSLFWSCSHLSALQLLLSLSSRNVLTGKHNPSLTGLFLGNNLVPPMALGVKGPQTCHPKIC